MTVFVLEGQGGRRSRSLTGSIEKMVSDVDIMAVAIRSMRSKTHFRGVQKKNRTPCSCMATGGILLHHQRMDGMLLSQCKSF
jgi:hypothetical protein